MFFNPTNIDVGCARTGVGRRSRQLPRLQHREGRSADSPGGRSDRHPLGQRRRRRADRAKTFVQDTDLRAPLGLAAIGHGVIVSAPPHLVVYTGRRRRRHSGQAGNLSHRAEAPEAHRAGSRPDDDRGTDPGAAQPGDQRSRRRVRAPESHRRGSAAVSEKASCRRRPVPSRAGNLAAGGARTRGGARGGAAARRSRSAGAHRRTPRPAEGEDLSAGRSPPVVGRCLRRGSSRSGIGVEGSAIRAESRHAAEAGRALRWRRSVVSRGARHCGVRQRSRPLLRVAVAQMGSRSRGGGLAAAPDRFHRRLCRPRCGVGPVGGAPPAGDRRTRLHR